jgi:hypothetical protein
MGVPIETAPRQGDTATVSALKSVSVLAGTTPPAPPAGSGLTELGPRQGDTLVIALKKICALLGAGAPISSIILANAGNQITLEINPDGDLLVTQQTGPNAGQTVNLTYGKWQ